MSMEQRSKIKFDTDKSSNNFTIELNGANYYGIENAKGTIFMITGHDHHNTMHGEATKLENIYHQNQYNVLSLDFNICNDYGLIQGLPALLREHNIDILGKINLVAINAHGNYNMRYFVTLTESDARPLSFVLDIIEGYFFKGQPISLSLFGCHSGYALKDSLFKEILPKGSEITTLGESSFFMFNFDHYIRNLEKFATHKHFDITDIKDLTLIKAQMIPSDRELTDFTISTIYSKKTSKEGFEQAVCNTSVELADDDVKIKAHDIKKHINGFYDVVCDIEDRECRKDVIKILQDAQYGISDTAEKTLDIISMFRCYMNFHHDDNQFSDQMLITEL